MKNSLMLSSVNSFNWLLDGKGQLFDEQVMIEKMVVAYPESEKFSRRSFAAAALRNFVKNINMPEVPDLEIHHCICDQRV